VEKVQYNLCCELLRRLNSEGVLDHVVLIGSWCLLAYEDYFKNSRYRPGIRTRDIDLLVPVPQKFDHKVDLETLLKDLDFVTSFKGSDGYMQFVHRDLILEFIVPERGRGSDKPFAIPDLGINAQPLRFMDFLLDNVIRLRFAGQNISVPHPAHFALLKLIVSARRQKPVKKANDLRQALEVMRALIEDGEEDVLKHVFLLCPPKWQKSILSALNEEPLTERILAILGS
jgi:hypothetical protein